MSTIGSLAVNIVATTDKFIAGLNQSQSALGRFVGKIATAKNALIGLGLYGFAAVVKGAVDAGGELFDFAQKLNISTEALGALHFAATQLGTTSGAVNSALAIMNRTLGQAAMGSDKAIGAFNQLGLSYQSLLRLPMEQQFLAIVDAISKLPSRAEQAAAAQAVFGKGAKELTALIAAGTTEIMRFGDEAAAAGILVGGETAEAMDEASDSITKLMGIWSGLKIAIVGDYAPEITLAIDGIVGAIKYLRAGFLYAQSAIIGGLELVGAAIIKVLEAANYLLPKFAEVDVSGFQETVDSLDKSRTNLTGKAAAVITSEGTGPLTRSTQSVAGHTATSKEMLGAAKQQAADKKAEEKEIAENTRITNAQLKEIAKAMKEGRSPNLQVAGVR